MDLNIPICTIVIYDLLSRKLKHVLVIANTKLTRMKARITSSMNFSIIGVFLCKQFSGPHYCYEIGLI